MVFSWPGRKSYHSIISKVHIFEPSPQALKKNTRCCGPTRVLHLFQNLPPPNNSKTRKAIFTLFNKSIFQRTWPKRLGNPNFMLFSESQFKVMSTVSYRNSIPILQLSSNSKNSEGHACSYLWARLRKQTTLASSQNIFPRHYETLPNIEPRLQPLGLFERLLFGKQLFVGKKHGLIFVHWLLGLISPGANCKA